MHCQTEVSAKSEDTHNIESAQGKEIGPSRDETADTTKTNSDEPANTGSRENASVETVANTLIDTPKGPPKPDRSVIRLIEKADRSAGKLVNLLAKHFPSFRDEARFEGQRVRFYKRAQIFVADLWAAFNGTGYGEFHDIGHLTMFAGKSAGEALEEDSDNGPDYRVPQMLRSLGVLVYSPPLEYAIRDRRQIASGHSWEIQLRGCSIWYERVIPFSPQLGRQSNRYRAVELIRHEIVNQHTQATNVNAVLIDFFLYDLAKEKEASGKRSRFYCSFRLGTYWARNQLPFDHEDGYEAFSSLYS